MEIKEIIVVGLGEVGQSWFKVVSNIDVNVLGIDINKTEKINKNKVNGKRIMHICLPFLKNFEKIATSYIKKYKPDLVIINTSCKVGITRKIHELTNVNMVHIPVRGVHPNIDKGIKTFVNAIGPINKKSEKLTRDYLNKIKIKYDIFNNPEETEMAKLLDTSYYGWNILFSKEVYNLCKNYNLDYENVYKKFNETYNKGYIELNKKNVIRPILIPPQIFNKKIGINNNKINGHCVRTNLEILKTMQNLHNIKFVDYAISLDEI